MLFAEMSDGAWVAVIGCVGSVCTILGGVVQNFWQNRRVAKDEEFKRAQLAKKDEADRYSDIITRLEGQIKRLEQNSDEQQKAINRLRYLHDDCQYEAVNLRANLQILHDYCRRANEAMKEAGLHCDGVPEMPPPRRPPKVAIDEADYLVRTSEQNRAVIKELDPTGPRADRESATGTP